MGFTEKSKQKRPGKKLGRFMFPVLYLTSSAAASRARS